MRVAIVGSGRTRVEVPRGDDWLVVGLGTLPPVVPTSEWYDVHELAPVLKDDPRHMAKLRSTPVVWVLDMDLLLYVGPNAKMLPAIDLVCRFGSEFLSSSVPIIMAHMIMRGATEIGLYGIEQSRKSVYAKERHGTMHMLQLCRHLGIGISMPDDCPLWDQAPMYPLNYEEDHDG
jgi:hypothetical protein